MLIDGKHAGYVEQKIAQDLVTAMRHYKIEGKLIPKETEVAWLKKGHFKNTVYPMIYITTAAARFLRPVRYLPLDTV